MDEQMIKLLLRLDRVQRSKLRRQINHALVESIEGDQPSIERAKFWQYLGDEMGRHNPNEH